jgi:histone-lysine N-methyltransferase SETMAR
VQKVSAVPVKIFDTGDRGWGLRTLVDISKGKFVMEYTGELVSSKIAKERSEKYDKAGLNYLLVVKEHCGDLCLRTNIDATFQGNAARYINHSCSPNLQPVLVRINTIVPHIGFFASQDIQKNEELTFSYGDATEGIHPCLCGSALCKGFLPYEQ